MIKPMELGIPLNAIECLLTSFIPFKRGSLRHQSGEWMTLFIKVGDETSNRRVGLAMIAILEYFEVRASQGLP